MVRAYVRWVIVGVWLGWLVIVGGRSSVCGLRASDVKVWCWFCWRGLVGGGGDIVVCSV